MLHLLIELGFGIIVTVAVIIAVGTSLFRAVQNGQLLPVIEAGMLGKEGIACGGPERLPCEPGFVCDADDDAIYGTCMEDTREVLPLGTEGKVCGGDRGCVPGLVCNAVGRTNGVCVKPSAR